MKRTIMMLFFVMFTVTSFDNPVIASVSADFCEYYPMRVGNKWTYVDDSAKLYYGEIKGTEILNGELTYQYPSVHNTAYLNLKCEAGIVTLVGFDGVPVEESPFYIVDGIDFETSGGKVLYSIEPQVITPAGTFRNVLKIERYDLNENMGRLYLDQEEYLAKGVGTIKDVNYWVKDPVNPGSYENTHLLHSFDIIPLLTQTQVSQLYVSIFGRASEGAGNAYWRSEQHEMTIAADTMLNTEPAKAYFGATLNNNQAFIEFIYKNTLGKDYAEDPEGVNYWVSQLKSGKSKGQVVATLINAAIDPQYAGLPAQDQFLNKVTVSNYTADTITTVPDVNDLSAFVAFISGVTNDAATVAAAKAAVNAF